MQPVSPPEDPYTLRRVVDNLFVERNHVRVVVPAPNLTRFWSFTCNAPIVVPTRCRRHCFAPPCQMDTFDQDCIGVGR